MKMSIMMAFCVILMAQSIGDVISAKTKAFVPSIFVTAVLFLLGFWTFFPKNIVDISGLGGNLAVMGTYLLVANMGTMMSVKELVRQWKTIVVALAGIAGIVLGTMTIGSAVFGWEAAVVATPPLTGGIVAAIIMSEGAIAKGLPDIAVLAILVFVAQGFAGYPLTAYCLRKEGTKLLKKYRSGDMGLEAKGEVAANVEASKSKFRIFPPISEKYNSTSIMLLRLGLVAWAAVAFSTATKDAIPKTVACLIFGVIASEIGFVERKALNLSGSSGLVIVSIMAYVFSGLSQATPEMVFKMAVPLVGIIFFGVVGMAIVSIPLGKIFGYSKEMAFAIALTALLGFPPNYIITEDVSRALAETKEEKEFLMDKMLPDMLIGGFATVTITSVIIAGIFIKFL